MTLFKKPLLALLVAAAFTLHAHADTIPTPVDRAYPGTIVLHVDASNTAQQIFRIRASIPAQPGKLTLLYPQWIPANHGPSGPINQLAGLTFTGNGKPLVWRRDTVNVFAFHIDVPAGVDTVQAEYQYLSPTEANQGRTTITGDILGVQWLSMALYPAGYHTRRINVQANLTLPQGWQFGGALETDKRVGDDIAFKPLDLETLADSPLFAGRYFKRYDLDPGARLPVHLNVVADTPEALEAKPEQIAQHRALVQQAYKLFNSQHYAHYDFLLALSDEFGGIGREHHQSSENGVKPDYFSDWTRSEPVRTLLPHEFTHSWNGKFRRPHDQDVPNFNTPLQNSLLWLYEGQTQYWGNVLASRSGLVKLENVRDLIAVVAARYDRMAGRSWRPVQDTTNDPIVNARRPQGWNSWQRAEDYYNEGSLIWLDVDTKIRELSKDRKSLDHFARSFYSVDDGSYVANHYTFDDVIKALNAVQPFDWAPFLRSRLDGNGPAPLDGLARAGWKLAYTDKQTDFLKIVEERSKSADFIYSLGFSVSADGAIQAVQWDGPAFKAGIGGSTTLVAVNGRAYKPDVLRAAVTDAAKAGAKPVELLVKKGTQFRTVSLAYHDGLKYPRLQRIDGTPDRLQTILQAVK